MDIGSISAAYSAIKAIKDIGSDLLGGKVDAEVKQRVADVLEKLAGVQDTLFFVREELLRIQDEKYELKNRIRQLEHEIEERGRVVYEKPSYWIDDGRERDGPFCQRCYDVDKLLVRLQGGRNDQWACRECNGTYYGPNFVRPKPRRVRVGGL